MADVTEAEISEEEILAEAPVVADRIVGWFRQRLRLSEAQRLAANDQRTAAEEGRVVAERDRAAAEEQRAAAEAGRAVAEQRQAAAERQQAAADRRVVEVEELLAAADELSRQLQHALDSRIVIEQAKGLLAGRYGVTPEAAFEALRHYARNNRLSLREVASELVSGKTALEM